MHRNNDINSIKTGRVHAVDILGLNWTGGQDRWLFELLVWGTRNLLTDEARNKPLCYLTGIQIFDLRLFAFPRSNK